MRLSKKNFQMAWGAVAAACMVWAVAYWHYLPHLPDTYSGEAVYGKVVDAGTGEPLAGAIVIGFYELNRPYSMEGGIIAGHMHIEEVMTDAEGEYALSAWGPKPRPGDAYLDQKGPLLVIYRKGYHVFTNPSLIEDRYNPVQTSYYSGRTIKLERFKGDLEAYGMMFSVVPMILDALFNPYFGARNCPWRQIPRMMVAMDELNQALAAASINVSRIPKLEYLTKEGGCGTREQFLREYGDETMDGINGRSTG